MFLKSISLLFLGAGVFVLMQVVIPFISYTIWERTAYYSSQFLIDPYPLAKPGSFSKEVLGVSVKNLGNFPAFVAEEKDSQKAFDEFKISVRALKIKDVRVKVDSNDFEATLAQLPGTALPGEKGNVFITGHSSLALSRNTKFAYFANLQNIKKGDLVEVSALGQNFTYEVKGIKIVDPKETWVIRPPDEEGRYMTLMTCVPPGFNTKRLVVLTELK